VINLEYTSRIAWTKFSILAKLQPELRTTASEKRRHYRWSRGRKKTACPPGLIPPTHCLVAAPGGSPRPPYRGALCPPSPPLSGAAPSHRHVWAAPWPPSCRASRATAAEFRLVGTTSVLPAKSPSTSTTSLERMGGSGMEKTTPKDFS
jgi:hypothetical protein